MEKIKGLGSGGGCIRGSGISGQKAACGDTEETHGYGPFPGQPA
ncbi:MAG: hypothetical protein ACLFPU_05505 [Dehalococcoidia bacterium]